MIHLHTHSSYSVGDAVGTPEDIVRQAAAIGSRGLAISEHGNLSSTPRFIRACSDKTIVGNNPIKPIIGMEAYFHDGSLQLQPQGQEKVKLHRLNTGHLLIGAMNRKGYENLVALNNESHHPDNFYFVPRMDWEMLDKYSEGLYCTSSCASGLVGNALIKHNSEELAEHRVKNMRDIFGDNFYLEVQPTDFSEQARINDVCTNLWHKLDIPLITTCDVHYPEAGMADLRSVRWAINQRKLYTEVIEDHMPANLWLQTDAEVYESYKDRPLDSHVIGAAIDNTHKICDGVEEYGIGVETNLPQAVPGNPNEYLRTVCLKKLQRINKVNEVYLERLLKELSLIISKGFSNYFIIVADLIAYAKHNRIAVGPGRGSATGSLVAYLLGITSVDPIPHNLLFERFLSEDREELPDIDIDIQDDRRHEVVEYFREKYSNVFNVTTYSMFKVRGLLRDTMRIMDIKDKPPEPGREVDSVEELMGISLTTKALIHRHPVLKEITQIA